MSKLWPYVTPGIPDALFEQLPGIPMSKREVRLILLGALRLQPDAVLWDIGAGCGDEAARIVQTMNDNGPSWLPGKQRGRRVKVQYNLPVKFRMDN